MSIAIRSIQHYMYCPRRFALLELNCDWAENAYVVNANIIHENVHNGRHNIHSSSLISISDVRLYNDDLDLYGVADCIEFKSDKNGDYSNDTDKRYRISLVEYKPTRPKSGEISETDAIQVFAQKLCVDYIWNCNSDAYIYYSDVKKRTKLPFNTEYKKYYVMLTQLLDGMDAIYKSGVIPQKKKGQKCSGCSLGDICLPVKIAKKTLKQEIIELLEE